MISYRIRILGLIGVFLLTTISGTAWADRGKRSNNQQQSSRHVEKGYELDKRHKHNQYYPRHGHVVKTLPRGYRTARHHRTSYFYGDGVWYRPSGLNFSVVAPPFGLVVPFLPPFYTTVWAGSTPYYYAGGTYYNWQPQYRGYVVTEPPPDADIHEEPEFPEQLFVYPKMGQNSERQSIDRYECHSWAVDQSGFDPTRPGGNVPDNENRSRREDYSRATKACLEARNYSVQ